MSSRPEDSRPANETKLDAWTAASADADPDPSTGNGGGTRPSSGRDEDSDGLAELFLEVTGDHEIVEPQQETPSHALLDGDNGVPDLTEDGLDDAAASDFTGGWI